MTKVKLCGLSRESDIAAVNKLKPDLVGFVFAKKSKRYVSPEQAEHLKSLLAPGILAAGVFVNEPVEAVAELLDRGVIDVAQLHGSEDDDYIARLRALTGLEHGKLTAERDELQKQIAYFNEVLRSEPLQMKIIKDELLEMKEKYSDERRTEIVYASEEFNPEDFYADDEMVITISHMGYIKRTPLAEYRTQNRGGVGAKGSATRDEDFIEHIYVATMHNTMLFFTEKGRCFWLKVYQIPEGTRSSKGRAIQNVIQIEPDDKVRAYINVKRLDDEEYVNNN